MEQKKQTRTKTETKVESAPVVKVGPIVKVVHNGKEHDFAFSDLDTSEDAATISDAALMKAAAKALGVSDTELKDHEIARVATGNILVSPRAVFG